MAEGRLRSIDGRPACIAAQPIALPGTALVDELSVLYGRAALPIAIGIAVGRNSASSADASSG